MDLVMTRLSVAELSALPEAVEKSVGISVIPAPRLLADISAYSGIVPDLGSCHIVSRFGKDRIVLFEDTAVL